jgi:hypothetical protein
MPHCAVAIQISLCLLEKYCACCERAHAVVARRLSVLFVAFGGGFLQSPSCEQDIVNVAIGLRRSRLTLSGDLDDWFNPAFTECHRQTQQSNCRILCLSSVSTTHTDTQTHRHTDADTYGHRRRHTVTHTEPSLVSTEQTNSQWTAHNQGSHA